jgi:serine/threonine protein kinase
MAADRDSKDALLGRTVAGKFLIESVVGEGAMGVVYKARQIALEKTVAIKVMHRDMADDELFVARFKREAKAASRLDHPNSMRVIDFGDDDGVLYIAMEFVDGKDLFQVIKSGWPLRNDRVIDVMMQALAALAVAHDMGVIHRDLKPENIMLLEGKDDEGMARDIVKVCDFGIAKIDARSSKDTGAKLSTKGLVVGTPEYMSPEQGRGEPLDSRCDIYSMGVILYQLITGRLPFDAESALGIVLKHVTEEPPRPRDIYQNVDPRLEAICLRAMQKKREARYQTAREMRSDLKAAAEGTVLSAPLVRSIPAPPTSDGTMEHAPTLRVHAQAMTPSPSTITPPLGTEATIDPDHAPGVPRGGGLVAALVVFVGLGVVGGGGYAILRATQSSGGNVGQDIVDASTASPSVTPLVLDTSVAPLASPAAVASHKPIPNIVKTAPSVSVSVSATPSASAPPVVDAGIPFDPNNAHVELKVLSAQHALPQNVHGAVVASDPTACFQSALKGGAKPADSKATLHIDIDATGHVTLAGLNGSYPAPAGSCILQKMGRREITGVTEAGSADIELHFLLK